MAGLYLGFDFTAVCLLNFSGSVASLRLFKHMRDLCEGNRIPRKADTAPPLDITARLI